MASRDEKCRKISNLYCFLICVLVAVQVGSWAENSPSKIVGELRSIDTIPKTFYVCRRTFEELYRLCKIEVCMLLFLMVAKVFKDWNDIVITKWVRYAWRLWVVVQSVILVYGLVQTYFLGILSGITWILVAKRFEAVFIKYYPVYEEGNLEGIGGNPGV